MKSPPAAPLPASPRWGKEPEEEPGPASSSSSSSSAAAAAAAPSFGRLLQVALLRVVARTVDAVLLLPRPALRRLWWAGLASQPSPYAEGFPVLMESRRHGVPISDFVYGEVFVAPTRRLLKGLGIGPGSVVVDLGCGRGAVLVASSSLGANSRGVELLPMHVGVIGGAAKAAGVAVVEGDARLADVDDADLVWLSWATWSPATRLAVRGRLLGLKPGALVCAVVHGVDDALLDGGFGVDGAFATVKTMRLWCSWGRTTVVVSRRTHQVLSDADRYSVR